jgi:choline-sulfatase
VDEACRILAEEAPAWRKPWVLFVSLTLPHHPLIAPKAYADLYPPESVVFPKQYHMADRPMHPALEELRRVFGLDTEEDDLTVRRAVAMYYAMCTLLDERCGQVLDALAGSGLAESTRVIYTSDHGDSVGDHGLWMKHTMYEGSVGVPFIMAGPDVPEGRVSEINMSHVDCFPTILEGLGVDRTPDDADLPGRSLFDLLGPSNEIQRTIFGEYHAEGSENGVFMIRGTRYKYIEYVNAPAQLFDLAADPDERHDLAGRAEMAEVIAACAAELRTIGDPFEIDRRAHEDQRRRIEAHGGEAAIRAAGYEVPFTPAPDLPGGDR